MLTGEDVKDFVKSCCKSRYSSIKTVSYRLSFLYGEGGCFQKLFESLTAEEWSQMTEEDCKKLVEERLAKAYLEAKESEWKNGDNNGALNAVEYLKNFLNAPPELRAQYPEWEYVLMKRRMAYEERTGN